MTPTADPDPVLAPPTVLLPLPPKRLLSGVAIEPYAGEEADRPGDWVPAPLEGSREGEKVGLLAPLLPPTASGDAVHRPPPPPPPPMKREKPLLPAPPVDAPPTPADAAAVMFPKLLFRGAFSPLPRTPPFGWLPSPPGRSGGTRDDGKPDPLDEPPRPPKRGGVADVAGKSPAKLLGVGKPCAERRCTRCSRSTDVASSRLWQCTQRNIAPSPKARK